MTHRRWARGTDGTRNAEVTAGGYWLLSLALGTWLWGVGPAIAATCAAPDDATQCATACSTSRDCMACCSAAPGDAVQCRRSCLSLHAPRPTHPHVSRPLPRRPTHAPGGPTASGNITASCSLQQAATRVDVTLRIENSTGATITTVLPANPSLQLEANTDFILSTSPSPPAYAAVQDGRAVTFLWRGRFNSAGAVGISVAAAARNANGATINTPLVDCGTATQMAGRQHVPVHPAPPPPQATPTLQGEAAQCAACHDTPQMAFVANKWAQSMHANSYGVSQGNTFCAQCHSPFQADANASAANNKTIPLQQWQGVICSSCHPSSDNQQQWGTPIATYDVASQAYTPVALGDANQLCFHCHNGSHAAKFPDGPGLKMMQSGVRCIDCHMAKITTGLDNVANTATHDLKVEMNLPNSCGLVPGGCHGGGTPAWALEQIRSGAIHGSQ